MPEDLPVSVSTDEVHAHPRHTGRSRVDLILALTAIFFSAVSLYVAMEHGKTQRDLVSASTWPFVGIGLNNNANAEGDIVISVGNSGVGPAKLQSFEVFYKGVPVKSALDLLRRCCGMPTDHKAVAAAVTGRLSVSMVDDVVLRAGEDISIITLRPDPQSPDMAKRLVPALYDLKFRGCYCSVLDECWVSDLASTRVKKVKACPAPVTPFDPNGS